LIIEAEYETMKIFVKSFLIILFLPLMIKAQQINISRIEQMPDQPEPYFMRDWKSVALGYDSLVFNSRLSGEYLPLIHFYGNTINYPEHESFRLHTVVGTTAPLSAEAINLLPAVISGALVGIDKSNQHGKNYVLMCEEFFNRRPEENVYLNNPVTTSGDDWWYETMPNVFFYQLADLYPGTGDFDNQFIIAAERWLEAVKQMGGSSTPWKFPDMNYRAFSLSSMKPNSSGVKEPEAAGAIAWILYNAYKKTGDNKYRIGAEWCLEFLLSLPFNPSYEIQLPYGALTAARMNAELGTDYNIEKIVNWCFSNYANRNWGTIVGKWGGYDVHGLIGETDSDGYAFLMNTFQQACPLVPLVRYDERFARAIGKWMLNAANAARLFYREFLPQENQDSYDWSAQYDLNSVIAHEAIRQSYNGKSPFASGDAISGGWGLTNLSLYSSSHAGIFGGIIETTNVEKILRLDLRKTDFYSETGYPSYLYYNPYNEAKTIVLNAGESTYDIYDLISSSFIKQNVSGNVQLEIPADAALTAVVVPSGGNVTFSQNKMLVNGVIVDFNAVQSINSAPRIKALASADSVIVKNDSVKIYCTAEDKDGDNINYNWQSSGGNLIGSGNEVTFFSEITGEYGIIVTIDDGKGGSASDTIIIKVAEVINNPPVINFFKAEPKKIDINSQAELLFSFNDPDDDSLIYSLSSEAGNFLNEGNKNFWISPNLPGNYYLTLTVSDGSSEVKDSVLVIVRDFSQNQTGNLILYLPFNGNAVDESGSNNDVFLYQASPADDRFNAAGNAYFFDGVDDHIQVKNTPQLNFQNSISVNFWIKIASFFEREAYPISHGNWESRWKISITNKKIRWTINTEHGIKDLDSETELKVDSFYNVTAVYNGADMEIYINGKFDAYAEWSGLIKQTSYDLMIAQALPANYMYGFKGVLDEIRIFDYVISMEQIKSFYDISTDIFENEKIIPAGYSLSQNFPNPFNPQTNFEIKIPHACFITFKIYDVLGNEIANLLNEFKPAGVYELTWNAETAGRLASGIYFYSLITDDFNQTKKMILLR